MSGNLEDQIDKLGATALRIKAERDELLAALENLVEWADSYHHDNPLATQRKSDARAAIRKARGE